MLRKKKPRSSNTKVLCLQINYTVLNSDKLKLKEQEKNL